MFVAIGDIHAYHDKFADLMSKLADKVDFEKDTLVFLGDYVDGGPDANDVVATLMTYQQTYPHWQFLMGNHEDLMLSGLGYRKSICGDRFGNNYYLWYSQGGRETLESYKRSIELYLSPYSLAIMQPLDFIRKEHLAWLTNLPLRYDTDKYTFVHAGLNPQYESSPADMLWIRSQFIDSDKDFGKTVVFGHTYQKDGPLVLPNKIGIDTMHHGGGYLTAALLGDTIEFVHSFES